MKIPFAVALLAMISFCRQESAPVRSEAPITISQQPTLAQKLVNYAKSLRGIPYKYAASDPEVGFDCSGFVNHVFQRFGFDVPRTSAGFRDMGTAVAKETAATGDIVLFTGTDPASRRIGHIGIVVRNDEEGIEFIHSTSGQKHSVVVTPLAGHYARRFVKVIRVI